MKPDPDVLIAKLRAASQRNKANYLRWLRAQNYADADDDIEIARLEQLLDKEASDEAR